MRGSYFNLGGIARSTYFIVSGRKHIIICVSLNCVEYDV
jgi:hypothetical protein